MNQEDEDRIIRLGTVVLGGISLILVVAVISSLTGINPFTQQPDETVIQTKFVATWNSSSETVSITHEGGAKIDSSNTEYLQIVVLSGGGEDAATIYRESNTSKQGLWFSAGGRDVSRGAVVESNSVTVTSDGIDSDGDGSTGIEEGDMVRVLHKPPAPGFLNKSSIDVLLEREVNSQKLRSSHPIRVRGIQD